MDNWQELIQDFLEEAYSLLDSLEDSLLQLEKNVNDKKSIDTVFRVAHTLKGGAGAVGFDDITKLTHIMEDVLDLVRQQKYVLTINDITLLLDIKDELLLQLKSHEQGQKYASTQSDILIKNLESIKQTALSGNSITNSTDTQPVQNIEESGTMSYHIDMLPMAARFGLTNETMASLHEALSVKEDILFVEIRLNEEYELKEVGPFEIVNLVNSFAEPVIMNPDIESLDEEYMSFLNLVIPCSEDPKYVQDKLSLPDVTTRVSVYKLTESLIMELENDMHSDIGNNIDKPIISEIKESTVEVNRQEVNRTDQQPVILEQKELQNESEVASKIVENRSHTLKVESSRIDELLNLLGELVIIRSGLNQFGVELEKAIYNTRLNLRAFLTSNSLLPLHKDPELNKTKNEQFRNDFALIGSNIDNFIEYIQQLSRISSTLQTGMMNLRMVPVQTVFSRFTRLVRDITKQLDKQVELIIEGGETEIDKGMIDDLYDPLMHMIRNSLDHGIEKSDVRISSHKSPIGKIVLKAYQEGDAIFIDISDDGKGIDADKIAQKAVAKGFVSCTKVENMSVREKLSLIFLPGFSTAEQVSNLSGRGVGMDVVHKNIQDLGGSVSVYSEVGKGTTIRIQLPLTLAIIQGLLLIIETVHYVIPISSVEETIILDHSQIYKLDHYHAFQFRDKLIPLISLSDVLYRRPSINEIEEINNETLETETKIELYHQYCIIVRYGSRQVGIIVPEIVKEQDIVVKPLDNRFIVSPGISAATIVGNGDVGFILDLTQIIRYYFK